jgi:hypothetical protein
MLGFLKKDPVKKLQKKYDKLMEESFTYSRTNRKLADEKYAEAEAVMAKIVALQQAM